jgi:peroxiredoxin
MHKRLLLAVLLGLLPWGEGARADDPFAAFGIIAAVAAQPAPDFRLANLHGGETGLSDLKGRVVLLNFWATWCEPCRREMPGLEALWRRYRVQGLTVLAVNEDTDGGVRAARFAARFTLGYPILLDRDGAVGRGYQATALPMSYLIGADGKILAVVAGARDWEGRAAGALIEQLLAQHR